ncbi:MAG: HYR domain-containing protein [Planctomycetota bacterium]
MFKLTRILTLVALAAGVHAADLYVNPDGNCGGQTPCFTTIQAAIDAASAGDTIHVAAATYEQALVINKAVRLLGAGRTVTIIDATGAAAAIAVDIQEPGGDVTFDGFTVKSKNSHTAETFAMNIVAGTAGATITVTRNLFQGTGDPDAQDYGVYIHGSSAAFVFQDNTITGASYNPLLVERNPGATTVADNSFDAGPWGSGCFYMTYGNTFVTAPQIFNHNTFDLGTSGNYTYEHRVEALSIVGAFLNSYGPGGYSDVRITNNRIYNAHAYGRAFGLYNDAGVPAEGLVTNVLIEGNTITGLNPANVFSHGLRLAGEVTNLTMGQNTITGMETGIIGRAGYYGTHYPAGVVVDHNRIASNGQAVAWDAAAAMLDAEENDWGAAEGPLDVAGTYEVSATDCGAVPADMKNEAPAGALGNPVSENVDYCPWLDGAARLSLLPQGGVCYEPNEVIVVEVKLTEATAIVVGGQFYIGFDPAKLTYLGGEPGDPPFTREIVDTQPQAGRAFYSVGHPNGGSGTSADTVMARLSFQVGPGVVECGTPALVAFAPDQGGYQNKLSDPFGEPVAPVLFDLPAVTIDGVPPAATPVTVVGGNVPPNNCELTVTFSATVTDNCCLDPNEVVVTVDLPTGNATLGTPAITKTPVGANQVDVTGSVLVSDLLSCPATVRVQVDAADCCGKAMATAAGTADVNDTTLPVITGCPADITVQAEAGTCAAHVSWTPPTASDNCGVASFTTTHEPGALFQQGTTTVTYTARDRCNNEETCSFDVTVNAFSDLVVTVELSPNIDTGAAYPQTLTRCITFELWDCAPPNTGPDAILEEELTFTITAGSPNVALAAATLPNVPCGTYECITARDRRHTTRRTVTLGINASKQFTASFIGDAGAGGDWLVGGNFNDDLYIDILDFGVYSWQYGQNYGTGNTTCATPHPHGDASGDGLVNSADFTFLQVNFVQGHEDNCCGQFGFDTAPVLRISLEELRKRGLAELSAGDWNHDGWLDVLDVEAFLQQQGQVRPGDLNCDGAVNYGDINPFVLILSDPGRWQAEHPGCPRANGDINRDGRVDYNDISGFVALVGGGV